MPAPPHGSGTWMPIRPSAASFGQQVHRERLRLVPRHDVRPDLGLGELAHRLAQELLFFGQPQIHRWENTIIAADALVRLVGVMSSIPIGEPMKRTTAHCPARPRGPGGPSGHRVGRHHVLSGHAADADGRAQLRGVCGRREHADRRIRVRLRASRRENDETRTRRACRPACSTCMVQTPTNTSALRDGRRRLFRETLGGAHGDELRRPTSAGASRSRCSARSTCAWTTACSRCAAMPRTARPQRLYVGINWPF